ncbi:hypothetical protein [Streptomyces sp. NPDC004528]
MKVSAGAGGQLLLQDQHLLEKLAHFHAADPSYGDRVAEAVRALRED